MSDPALAEVTSERLIAELAARYDVFVLIGSRNTRIIGGPASISFQIKGDVFACLGLATVAAENIRSRLVAAIGGDVHEG